MERLIQLYEEQGQSPWLDNLTRGYLTSGQLETLRDGGIRGLTSNPTIFQKAIEGSPQYDEQFRTLAGDDAAIIDDYWALVLQDITGALEVFAPLYQSSGGGDGFVSVEVAPDLAHDTDGTIASARHLNETIARPNLLVKGCRPSGR
jgi:transaldolase